MIDGESVQLLQSLVSIYSPSGHEHSVAELIRAWASRRGLHGWIDDVGNSWVEAGQGPVSLVMLGHMDTVEGELPVKCEDNILYGRGSVDAKGALATFLSAVASIAAAERLSSKVVVIGAVEEETLTSRGSQFVTSQLQPQYCIVGEPSGWSGVTLGYKGRMAIRYHLSRRTAHAAARGESPPQSAINFWNALSRYQSIHNQGKSTFYQLDLSLDDFQVRRSSTDVSVTMTGYARMPLGVQRDELKNCAIESAGDGTVSFVDDAQPFMAPKSNPLVREFLKAIRGLGGTPAFIVKTGTSDMNIVGPVWQIPIVAYGPGDSTLDHTPDERLDLAEYQRAIDVLQTVIVGLLRVGT